MPEPTEDEIIRVLLGLVLGWDRAMVDGWYKSHAEKPVKIDGLDWDPLRNIEQLVWVL